MTLSHMTKTPLILSAEQLKSWSRCQKQFQFKSIEKRQWPVDTRHFRLGKYIHKWLEYQAAGLDVTPFLSAEEDPKLLACWSRLQAHEVTQWPIVASEYPFHMPLEVPTLEGEPPLWCHGRIDRIALRPATATQPETLVLLDWKTGTAVPKNPSSDWQYMLYTLAVEKLLLQENPPLRHPITQRRLSETLPICFIYVQVSPQLITLHELPWSSDISQRVQMTLQNTLQSLLTHYHQNEFNLPPLCPDAHCAYRAICGITTHTYETRHDI